VAVSIPNANTNPNTTEAATEFKFQKPGGNATAKARPRDV